MSFYKCKCSCDNVAFNVVSCEESNLAPKSYLTSSQGLSFIDTVAFINAVCISHIRLTNNLTGGPDENIKNLYNKIVYSDGVSGINRFVCCYDWSAWVGNLFRAAYDSEHVGKVIGSQVAESINNNPYLGSSTRNIHVIGISVGAFAANSFLSTLTSEVLVTKNIYRRLTLLDPFTSKGIFGPAYGPRQFGKAENTGSLE